MRLSRVINKQQRIPQFKSIREEAEFGDTHDTTDFEDEFRPANVQVSKGLSHILPVRSTGPVLSHLEKEAERRGIGPSTLIRIWIMERLTGAV